MCTLKGKKSSIQISMCTHYHFPQMQRSYLKEKVCTEHIIMHVHAQIVIVLQ